MTLRGTSVVRAAKRLVRLVPASSGLSAAVGLVASFPLLLLAGFAAERNSGTLPALQLHPFLAAHRTLFRPQRLDLHQLLSSNGSVLKSFHHAIAHVHDCYEVYYMSMSKGFLFVSFPD